MKIKDFTVPIEQGMHVRHDAQARFTVKSGRRVLEDRLTGVADLGGAFTVACIIYNGLSMSGGVAWRDPVSRHGIDRPYVKMRVRAEDVLADGELCGCGNCQQVAA